MKFKLLLLLIVTVLNSQGQEHRLYYTDVDFWETQADTLSEDIHSVHLIGIGASLERIFFTDLSDKLIADFKSRKIQASYTYLGKSLKEAQANFNDTVLNKCEAILLIYPTDTATFESRYIESRLFVPLLTSGLFYKPSRHRDSYEQFFQISLYKTGDSLTRIWNAKAYVDCEPGKKTGSKKIGNNIVKQFLSNKYIK